MLNKGQCRICAVCIILGLIVTSLMYFNFQKQDINQLTDNQLRSELVEIKGIGTVTAEKVVNYRAAHKPITIGELDEIKGIGDKRLALIKKKFKDY